MVKLANRVKVSTATTGTGTIEFGSAETGYKTLTTDDGGGIYPYVIEDGNDYEVGEGLGTIGRLVSEYSPTQVTNSYSIKFKPDGTELYVICHGTNAIYQYSLSTAWDITTASYTGSLTVYSGVSYSFEFNDTGTTVFCGGTYNGLYKYTLSTAWDISTASYSGSSSLTNYIYEIHFYDSGNKVMIARFPELYTYSLSTPYDLFSTRTSIYTYNPASVGSIYSACFNSDGTKLFLGALGQNITVESLSTAYDLSTASFEGFFASLANDGQTIQGLTRKDDTTLFIIDGLEVVQEISSDGVFLERGLMESSTGSLLNLSGSAKVFISPNTNLMQFQSEWGNDPSNNKGNLPIGESTLASLTTGYGNVAIGQEVGQSITTGQRNVAVGYEALNVLTNASYNVAVGASSLRQNTGGSGNIAMGYDAGNQITTEGYNTTLGYGSSIYTGATNGVAVGASAKASGVHTVSIGNSSGGATNSSSDYNVNIGSYAARLEGGGDYNIKIGYRPSYSNYYTGHSNVVIGRQAEYSAQGLGTQNVSVGAYTNYNGYNNDNSVSIGTQAGYYNYSNDYCTNIGFYTGNYTQYMSGSYCTSIGAYAQPSSRTSSGQFTLGNGNVTNLRCNDTSISSLSDERDKTNIQDIPYGLDFINDVRPVTFDWSRRDGTMANLKDIGFIAQDLADVELEYSSAKYTRLVDFENPEKLEARPQAMFPILVKAVQELSQKNDALEARIAALEGN